MMKVVSTTDFFSLFLAEGTIENQGKELVAEQEKAQAVREAFRARQTAAKMRRVALDLSKLVAAGRRGE